MASASFNFVEKEIVKKETIQVKESVSLVLTPLEAFALNNLLIAVGGCSSGARGLLDNIASALDDIGLEISPNNNYNEHRSTLKDKHSSIYFNDESRKLLEEQLKSKKII